MPTRFSHARLSPAPRPPRRLRRGGALAWAGLSLLALAPVAARAQSYTLTDLGTLGGTSSLGFGVNASGQVTGQSTTAGGSTHAFLSGPSGAPLTAANDLGTLGGTNSYGNGVNASGQVVGDSDTASGADHAFLFSGGVLTDLNTLIAPGSGFTLVYAYGISDTGFISGYGINSSGQQDAFLLRPNAPVPEASSVVSLGLLLVLGMGGLVVAARRKKVGASL